MANVKISALPAATTPLAGTEVLPIVQSGVTAKVSVADLTSGRAITASSVTDSALTSGRVTYAGTAGLLQDSANLLFNGTTLTANTLNLTNALGIAYGGTGQITANASFNALAPSQTGNSGKYLTTDGANTSWATNPLGTVTSITAGTGLTGGTITTSGTIAIDTSVVATLTGTQTLTNKTISGASNTLSNIGNASLTNSAITINGTSTSLGGSISVGTVTSVTGTAPVSVATGTSTPVISMAAANTSTNGYLTSTDWNTFNGKSNTNGTVTSVAALTLGTTGTDLSSTVATGTTTPVITLNVPTASAANRGVLSSADWTTFNNKQPAGTYVTSVTGTAPVVSSGGTTPALSMAAATTSVNGYLTSTDWTTFNGKQAALVSGTNIKTVNGTTLLGSGDLGIITGTYGGTGINNGANTITIAGNLTHAGAFTQSFTATANTAVTLPAGATAASNNLLSSATAVGIVTGTPSSTTYLRGDGTWSGVSGASGGTVTSVAATVPAFLSITGSPITTSGTLAIAYSGTALPVANGGTGLTSLTANQVLYGSFSQSANLQFNGTTLTTTNDASISGLTVGKGGGAISSNTAFGVNALVTNSAGTDNTAVGINALNKNTGSYNSAFGVSSLYANTSGTFNTAYGWNSLPANTSGSYNVGVGPYALNANTTASNNTAVGYQAGYTQTTGGLLTVVGYRAGYSNTGGPIDAFGITALYSNTSGANNVGMGYQSLYSNQTGDRNTAVGVAALYSTTGGTNTGVGYYAGNPITSGTDNTCLGNQSGNWSVNLTTGSKNTYLGTKTSPSSGSVTEEIVIGYLLTGKGANTAYIGGSSGSYQGNNAATWSVASDKRLKKNIIDNTIGLNAITAIQVRNFEYCTANEITELEPQNAIDIKGIQLGVIAQELKEILPDCVKTESTGVMSVDTTNLTWYLINAVKELKAEIDLLKAK